MVRFWAAYLMTTDKRGISALLLQRQLGLGCYETAWMMLHKFRRAMVNLEREPLRGEVEVDKALVQIARPIGYCGLFGIRGGVVSKLSSLEALFAGRHFDREVIILCVRWYLRYKLSFRDLVEMMAERGLNLAHTTILRWVRRYAPEFVKRWNRFGRTAGRSWRVDETYIKERGHWTYLYRAVDKAGQTIDFRLSRTRKVAAAKAFFKKAIKHEGRSPHTITLDGYVGFASSCPRDAPRRSTAETDRGALFKVSEQPDRAGSPRRQVETRPLLGFKNFESAAITIAGVELLRRIHKGSGANNKNSTPYRGVKQVRVASSPSFLHIEG